MSLLSSPEELSLPRSAFSEEFGLTDTVSSVGLALTWPQLHWEGLPLQQSERRPSQRLHLLKTHILPEGQVDGYGQDAR